MNNLTFEDKLKLLRGKNDWQTDDLNGKMKSAFMADGPHGLRKMETDGTTHVNTAYPSLSVLARTWNAELAFLMGESIADDCIENDVDILLAPGVNVKRSPLCGRNFEYFSEDPYLSGELAYNYIQGVQSKGIGTSLKHFACNNAENYRHYGNSEVDDRTLFEVYLPAFRRALEANPYTVMCSYNVLNGVYASENKKLLKDILRGRFGFDGVIISDWDAVKNRARALKATLDIEMPYNAKSVDELKDAYQSKFIDDKDIDDCVERILALLERIEANRHLRKVSFTSEMRHRNAYSIATEGIVLLKNENDILPLDKKSSITVYSDWRGGYAFERIGGGGSSAVCTNVKQNLVENLKTVGYTVFPDVLQNTDNKSDIKIVTVAASVLESESADRTDISLRKMEVETILRLCEAGERVIVVIYAGSAVDVSPFVDKVSAIIYAGFGGEAINEALADVISGKVCPSGKLAETFSNDYIDPNADASRTLSVYYKERHYFGYRYFDRYGVSPQYSFGFGLSYAKFVYSDLKINKIGETDYELSYIVSNVSTVDGKEVSQIYVGDEYCTSDRPKKELKAFSKDFVKAGESKKVTVKLDRKAFEFYNPSIGDYYVENGKFNVYVCAACNDVRLCGSIVIELPKYSQVSRTHGER